MGHSYTAAAADTLAAALRRHASNHGTNTYSADGGRSIYFHEEPTQQRDGSIVAEVFKFKGAGAIDAGTLRIEPTGRITRFPGIPKAFWAGAEAEAKIPHSRRASVAQLHY